MMLRLIPPSFFFLFVLFLVLTLIFIIRELTASKACPLWCVGPLIQCCLNSAVFLRRSALAILAHSVLGNFSFANCTVLPATLHCSDVETNPVGFLGVRKGDVLEVFFLISSHCLIVPINKVSAIWHWVFCDLSLMPFIILNFCG
jgi:hypothetical protein